MSSDNTPLLIVLGSILLLSLFYLFGNGPIHNEGQLQFKRNKNQCNNNDNDDNDNDENDNDADNDSATRDQDSGDDADSDDNSSATQQDSDADDSVDTTREIIRKRAMGQNNLYFRKKSGGKYKHDSYRALGSGECNKAIDKYFKVSDVTKNYTDRYSPIDESCGEGAPINIRNNKGTEKDKYDVNGFLPQEKNKDWFECIEPVNVKQSNLINIYRPIGTNTIGSSHRICSYDIRGNDKAICPKFNVSPWMQSSVEPDRSMKSLC